MLAATKTDTQKVSTADAPAAPHLVIRRSFRSMLLPLTIVAAAEVALTFTALYFPFFEVAGVKLVIPYYWLMALPLAFLAELLRRYYNSEYIFERSSMTGHLGHLSFRYRVPNVKYCDVIQIRICQSIFGRLLGYGDLCVHTTARECPELRFCGVLKPLDLGKFLDELRDRACSDAPAVRRQCTYKISGKVVDKLSDSDECCYAGSLPAA